MIPTKQSIKLAYNRIRPYIHNTPLLESSYLRSQTGTKSLFFKCENFQKTGAFKVRGACNTLLKMLDKNQNTNSTVCAHSSGNHAMALSYMSKILGFKAYIVMPENSPQIKRDCVQGYGGEIVLSGNTVDERQKKCQGILTEKNATLVHGYDNYDIIEGQGTWVKQVLEELQPRQIQLDYILFPIGGGGLGSGTVLTTKYFTKNCKAIGVEPYLARDAYLSLQQQKKHGQLPPITISDGLRVSIGIKAYDILSSHLSKKDILLVSDEETIEAMRIVYQRMKIVIEPSSATVVAAILKESKKPDGGMFKNKNVCAVLSGGNVNLSSLFDNLNDRIKDIQK